MIKYLQKLTHLKDNLKIKLNWKKIFIAFYVLLTITGVYHIYYAKKIIPGVKIGSVELGGLTYEQALDKLRNTERSLDKRITFKYKDRTFEITGDKIGFIYDWNSSVARAFEVGRTKNIFIDTKDKLAGIFKPIYLPPFYDYEDKILENELLLIKGEVSKVPVDAHFVLDELDNLSIIDSSVGYKISEDSLKKIVVYAFDRLDYGEKELPIYEVHPQVSKQDLDSNYNYVSDIISKTFAIKYKDKSWKLSKKQLADLVSFKKVTLNNGEKNGKDRKEALETSLNDIAFGSVVHSIGQDINILPRGQVKVLEDNRVADFEIVQEGLEVDEKKFTEDFKTAFFGNQDFVEVPVLTVSSLDKDKYGIYSLLGEGVSKYTGSGISRVNNLSLAAERTNGVLVPPNGIYSMNRSIGDISAANGYDTAYVIKEGRTVLGEGGGVCQTSTTLFRAVLNAGLPIVMRYPHDYRVSYYEIESPVGLDASIFQPSLDFQFKNDTPNYLLIQMENNKEEYTLKFRIYGTPDGRFVTLTEPVVTGVTPPPEALYQNDANLPKGVVKQIDFPAWGSNVSFTRTVKRDDEVLSEDTFNSRYRPWRAIYLVGTKE